MTLAQHPGWSASRPEYRERNISNATDPILDRGGLHRRGRLRAIMEEDTVSRGTSVSSLSLSP
jgi:hypothetical protein